jgi:hypothetical protein
LLQFGSGFEWGEVPELGVLRSLVRLYSTSMKRKTSARAASWHSQTVVHLRLLLLLTTWTASGTHLSQYQAVQIRGGNSR